VSTAQLVFDILANDKASKIVEGVGNTIDGQQSKWNGWKTAGVAAAGAVGIGLLKFGTDSVQAFSESQESAAALDDAFARFPALADTNAEALRELNSELAKKTRFDDDATASGQAVLAQFGLTGQQVTQLTPLLQDYAAKTGKDLPTAADSLGKAILGQGRALKEVGIDFQDTGSAAGNFDQLVAGLTEKVGGYAEVAGGTAAGQSEILSNQFGELQEAAGERLMPALTGLLGIGIQVMDWVNNNTGLAMGLAVALGVLTGAVMLAANWETIFTTAKTIGTAAQWAWNAAMSANPVGLIVIAIAALIGIIVLLVKNWDDVKAAGAAAWDWIKSAWSGAGSFFSGIGDAISGVFKSAFNKVAGWWNDSIGDIGFTIPDWVPGIGGKRFDVPDIPMLAKGGDITGSGLVIVGEQGPELLDLNAGARVSPLNPGRGGGNAGAGRGGLTVNGDIHVGRDAQVAEIIDEIEWRSR